MPRTTNARPLTTAMLSLLLTTAVAGCDPAVADTGFGGAAAAGITTAAPAARPSDSADGSGSDDGSSGYGPDTLDPSTTGGETPDPGAADDTTTGGGDEDPTTSPTFPPTTTGGGGGTGDAAGCTADVMLSLDVSVQNFWPLRRLAGQVVAIDGALRAGHGVDVRWYVMPWIDALGAVDTLEGWGSDPDAFAAANAVETWASLSQANVQPDGTGAPNLEPDDAGLSALAAVAAWEGWRPGATRFAVHVTDSGVVEAPAVLSGYPVAATYADTAAALVAAEVHTVAWAPLDAPGYAAPYGAEEMDPIPSAAYDVKIETAPNLTEPVPGYRDAIVESVVAQLTAEGCL